MKLGAQVGLWKRTLVEALKDISAAGLEGIETFELIQYYDNPSALISLLKEYNVALSGMYYAGDFTTPENQSQELQKATKAIQFLKAVNSRFLILHSGSLRKEEEYPIQAYNHLADTMNKIGEIGHQHGVKIACHPHMGTMVETRRQLDLLMERLDHDLVGLCPHASHFLYTNTDPYDIYRIYAKYVTYVHVSDMKGVGKISDAYRRILEEKKKREEVFKEMGIGSTSIGHGEIDQKALMKPLLKAGFDGWIIIEGLDSQLTPIESIRTSTNYIKKELLKK